jgi:hypothetical protein
MLGNRRYTIEEVTEYTPPHPHKSLEILKLSSMKQNGFSTTLFVD